MARRKRIKIWGITVVEGNEALFERIDLVVRTKGMSRKGFILHAIANTYPELTAELVAFLLSGDTQPRDRKAVLAEMDEGTEDDQ